MGSCKVDSSEGDADSCCHLIGGWTVDRYLVWTKKCLSIPPDFNTCLSCPTQQGQQKRLRCGVIMLPVKVRSGTKQKESRSSSLAPV